MRSRTCMVRGREKATDAGEYTKPKGNERKKDAREYTKPKGNQRKKAKVGKDSCVGFVMKTGKQ